MFYYEAAILGHKLPPLTYEYDREIAIGAKALLPLNNFTREAIILRRVEKPEFNCKKILEISDEFIDEKYIKTAIFLADYYLCHIGEILTLFFARKNVELEAIRVATQIELSDAQKEALKFIDQNAAALLFGDTGSGKSEIYMKLFERVLNENKTALFLMPEISLTPQIEKRLTAHFGDLIAIWHSKVTPAKKRAILGAIESGKIRIVAGARSALFLPLKNLGAIVVDEEHDESYKSTHTPKINARDAAIVLAKTLEIPCVLGSATPSATSFARFPYFRLKGQFFKEGRRSYEFVARADDSLAPQSIAALKEAIAAKKQAIVFLPTRANFKYLLCRECGKASGCPFCAIAMSLHRNEGRLVCHYCGFAARVPKRCEFCGGELESKRHGTAEIAELIRAEIPQAKVSQFDRDAIKSDAALRKVLEAFNDQEIDILVGTQMLSKGHNYHGVALAIAIGLDHILAQADYRGRERAAALLTQLSGRAGRSGEAKVVVQSCNKAEFEPFLEDYEAFLRREIAERGERGGLYPPHTRLLRALIARGDQGEALALAANLAARVKAEFAEVEVIGSGECGIAKIKTKFRAHILMRSKSARALIAVGRFLAEFADMEIDPLSVN
ncbi:MAG: primosomal protein N' [Helicobacteraceae bacterium]|jgi:primosomal protein N' (replication factor Y)|nr:primosomal protein N' [Helicobacteraceae bacterium]